VENDFNKSRIARLYNVSQNSIRKWCKKYNIKDVIININMSKPTKERK